METPLVDAVVITHLHGDHFGGLPSLILDGQFSRRTKTLTVLGPVGAKGRHHSATEVLYPVPRLCNDASKHASLRWTALVV